MLRSVTCALALALLAAPACSNSTVRSQEGHACSTSSSDDPQFICTPALDLVCIATYSRTVTNPKEAGKFDGGVRQVYVCRLACDKDEECREGGDVCCKGPIYGKTYNKSGGCVPLSQCDYMNVEMDGGAAEAGAPDGGASTADAAAGAADAAASAADAAASAG
jgi:hypothetical protein